MPDTYNKVVINGTTYIDLSADTVTAASMRSGVTAHDANGASVTGEIADVTPAFDGGGLTGSNATLSTSNTSGIYVRRAAVLYNGAANGYIDVADNTSASAQVTRYVTKVNVPVDKSFEVTQVAGTALDSGTLTVANNLYRVMTFTNSGRMTGTNSAGELNITQNQGAGQVNVSENSGSITIDGNKNNVTVNAFDNTKGNVTVKGFADTSDTTGTSQAVVANGVWATTNVTPSTSAQGPYYGKTSVSAMPTGSVSASATGSATVSSLTYTYNSTNSNFGVTGSATISGTATASVGTAGYVSSGATGSTTGTASVSATVAKVALGCTNSGTTTAQKPTISRTSTTATGATNVGSGTATTTAPSSGCFVSVQSAAKTGTLTATPKVTTAGYGTTSYYTATAQTSTVGAAASDVTYITVPKMTLPTATSSTATGTSKLSITPGTAAKYINIPTGYNTAASYYTVQGDANLVAANIAKDVQIFGVTGTFAGGGPTVTLNSGGVTWATCCTFPSNGIGWREEKFSDGRLVRYVWDWFTMSSAGRSSAIATSGATAFVGTPIFTPSFRANGNYACKGSITAWSNTSCTIYLYENSYGGRVAVCIKMEGFWQ